MASSFPPDTDRDDAPPVTLPPPPRLPQLPPPPASCDPEHPKPAPVSGRPTKPDSPPAKKKSGEFALRVREILEEARRQIGHEPEKE